MSEMELSDQDKLQWLLDFRFRRGCSDDLTDDIYILNVDMDVPNEAELINLKGATAVVAIGDRKSLQGHEWELDFTRGDFRAYYGESICSPALAKKFAQKITFKVLVDPVKGPRDGAMPICQMVTKSQSVKYGRAIPVTFDAQLLYQEKGMPLKPTSWSEYVRVHSAHAPSRGVLFRGQGESTWSLTPSYYRNSANGMKARILRHLEQIDSDRHLKSAGLIPRMAEAQHNGYPTVLLDWTECPFIAAYFALSGQAAGEGSVGHARIFQANTEGYYYDALDIFHDRAVSFFSSRDIGCQIARAKAESQRSHFSFSILRRLSNQHPTPSFLGEYWDIAHIDREEALHFLREEMKIDEVTMGLAE